MPQNKRRGTQRPRKGGAGGDESGSESGEDRSPDGDEPSLSPDIPSQPVSRRSSNVGRGQQQHEGYPPSLPSMSAISDRERERREESSVASSSRPKLDPSSSSGMQSSRGGYFPDNEVPHIATLPLTEPSPPTPAPMSAPTLPPIRPASELQAAQRKRASTMPGKSTRQTTTSGPKVVACNFCRGRLYCRCSCYLLCLHFFKPARRSATEPILLVRAALAGSWIATMSMMQALLMALDQRNFGARLPRNPQLPETHPTLFPHRPPGCCQPP